MPTAGEGSSRTSMAGAIQEALTLLAASFTLHEDLQQLGIGTEDHRGLVVERFLVGLERAEQLVESWVFQGSFSNFKNIWLLLFQNTEVRLKKTCRRVL